MHCLYCGKPLGFLKELTDGEFCSSSHRQRYKKLTKLALSRLLETQPQELPEEAKTPERPRMPAWGVAARKRADFGKLFCPSPQATQLPAHVQGAEEPIGRPPSTALPGFAQAPLTPALGNASLVWAKLEPAAPQAGLFMQVPVEPSDASGPMLRFASLSGLLRQGIAPSLRQAGLLPPPTPGLQSIRSSHVVEDRTARPVLMFAPAIARPSLARVAEPPSLPLAPSIQITLEAALPDVTRPILESAATPKAFQLETAWREATSRLLKTVDFPVAATLEAIQQTPAPTLVPLPLGLRPAPLAAKRLEGSDWQPWKIAARVGRMPIGPDFRLVLPGVGLRTDLASAAVAVEQTEVTSVPAHTTPATLGFLPLTPACARSEARMISAVSPLRAAVSPVLPSVDAALSALAPIAGFAPPLPSAQPAAAAMLRDAEALAPAIGRPRLPVLREMPVRERLRLEGAMRDDVRGSAAAPIPMQDEPQAAAPLSMLPSLATLFRYARWSRSPRASSVAFEGIHPRNMVPSRIAFRELPMPIPAPLTPSTSALRIIETFHYLRPLEQPGVEPLQALLNFWKSVPVYLRFATAAACLVFLVWVAAPRGRITNAVVARWGTVQRGIENRAAVELADDFHAGLANWQGQAARWERTWSYDEAGFVRPGRLALYTPSTRMKNYRVEFLVQIDRKSASWVYRAADHLNYYAAKLKIMKPGPLPSLSLIRYPVIGGTEGPRVEVPIRLFMHNNTPYRVQLTVQGTDFTTMIEGQIVDFWRDDKLQRGGFGFFSDTGEQARVYWMKLSHQDDFVGRVCAYFYQNPIHRKRSEEIYQ